LPDSPFFAADELKAFGFSDVGDNIQVSRRCSFYRISGRIGSNVRIDDFCIFKGHVEIGSYVHVAAFCSVSGAFAKVELKDFCTLSNRVSIFTGSDDYSADTLNNSEVPEEFTTIKKGPVVIGQAVARRRKDRGDGEGFPGAREEKMTGYDRRSAAITVDDTRSISASVISSREASHSPRREMSVLLGKSLASAA